MTGMMIEVDGDDKKAEKDRFAGDGLFGGYEEGLG